MNKDTRETLYLRVQHHPNRIISIVRLKKEETPVVLRGIKIKLEMGKYETGTDYYNYKWICSAIRNE